MHATPAGPEVVVWTGPRRSGLIGRLLDVMAGEVTPIGVGGPRSKPVSELAAALDRPCEDDLRKLIVEYPAAYLLLGEHQGVSIDDLKAAAAGGAVTLTLEPLAGDFDTLDQLEPILDMLHTVPGFAQSPGSLASANPAETLEDRRVIRFDSVGSEASLYARLWDAWATTLAYLPVPESIDAALTPGPVPAQLVALEGRLTAHGRLAEAGSVSLMLTDVIGAARRSLHVIADNAELRATDGGYELHQADGTLLDEGRHKGPLTWVDLIAHQWRRLIDRPGVASGHANLPVIRNVLACCLATLLSARTGQAERPAALLQMHV